MGSLSRVARVCVVVAVAWAQPASAASLWDSIVDGAKSTYGKLTGKDPEGETPAASEAPAAAQENPGAAASKESAAASEPAPASVPKPEAADSPESAVATESVPPPATASPADADATATVPPAEEKGMLDKTLDVMKGAYDAVDERRRAVVERTYTREAGLWGVGGLYAPLALPFPSSYGLDAYYVSSPTWTWEFEYRRSTIDIGVSSFNFGKIEEQYFTLQARHFPRQSSLNVIYGLSYRTIEIQLARDSLELFTEDYSLAYSKAHSYVGKIGVGSHYRLNKRWTFDVDWIAVNIVIDGEVDRSAQRYASTEQGRKNARRAERFITWYPSMTAFQMRLGLVW